MTLSVDFDLIVLMVAIAMMIIGYLSGATVEIIRLLKLIVPFVIISIFGVPISRLIVRSKWAQHLFSKYKIFTVIPYINTFMVVVSLSIVFIIIYYFMEFFLRRIQKTAASELVKFRLGHLNHFFGGVLSLVRLYILLSLLILPFVVMGFTSKREDFTTRAVLSYSPRFIQSPQLVNESSHLIEWIEDYSYFLELMDLSKVVNELDRVEEMLSTERASLVNIAKTFSNPGQLPVDDPLALMSSFILNPDPFYQATSYQSIEDQLTQLYERIDPYRGFILWAEKHQSPNLTQMERLKYFVQDFEWIREHTQNIHIRRNFDDYQSDVIVYQWLTETVGISIDHTHILFNDDYAKRIIDRLLIELDTGGLIDALKAVDHGPLNRRVKNVESFLSDYRQHSSAHDHFQGIPLIYQIIAERLIESRFMKRSEQSPLVAMYAIDTLNHIARMNLYFPDDNFYQVLVKIYVPLYLTVYDEEKNVHPIDDGKMQELLKCVDKQIDQVRLTDEFAQQMSDALVDGQVYDEIHKENIPYVEYLVQSNLFTREALERLSTSSYLSKATKEKLVTILSEMGD